MIYIKKSPTADTRTCDVSKVSKEQLEKSSLQHIDDVRKGLNFFKDCIESVSLLHDYDKVNDLESFYHDFKNNFETNDWYKNHLKVNRHHLSTSEGVPNNVNLIDVLEYITDCVMAGLGRKGVVSPVVIDQKVLNNAFKNTTEFLYNNVTLTSGEE